MSSLSSHSSDDQSPASKKPFSSSAEYDRIRNETLMFFLDRLYLAAHENKEPKSLHELSCLFGSREFTKEMREIVGASRNGLRKFLESYPSLFTIDGDRVQLSQLCEPSADHPTRDYNKEACDYFRDKLLQFGDSQVPIKYLFGYRSQASQEVRHVSGKSVKEFCQFLEANSGLFEMLPDEHVVLRSSDQTKPTPQPTTASKQPETTNEAIVKHPTEQSPCQQENNRVVDPYLNKQLANAAQLCLKQLASEQAGHELGHVQVDSFHRRVLDECQNKLFLKIIESSQQFRVFLRMHPKLFKRIVQEEEKEELVALVSDEERRELDLQAAILRQQQAAKIRRANTNDSDNQSSCSSSAATGQPLSLPPTTRVSGSRRSSLDEGADRQAASSALSASAAPFVPANRPAPAPVKRKPEQRALQRSVSNLGPAGTKQALRSFLLKASQTNTAQGLYSPSKLSNGAAHAPLLSRHNSALTASQVHTHRQAINGSNNNNNNTHKLANMNKSVIVPTADELRARTVDIVRETSSIVTKIMNTTDAIAFDCKGYNLGFDGQITLIQFAYLPWYRDQPNGRDTTSQKTQLKPEVCIFDLITNPELAYCLKPLLESEKIIKIIHDVRNKSNALFSQFNIMLNCVFDTQVANLVIQQQETGKPAYKSRYISMERLCELYGDESLTKYRNLIKSKTRHTPSNGNNPDGSPKVKDANYWRVRPITDAMVYESTMDVYCLIGGVYQNLKSKILPEYEPLFEQLNVEGVLARIKPDEIKSVKKERKIDLEVIDLKRKLYSDTTSSIVLSNREIRLLRHIDLSPEVRNKIQQCKKVAKKLERLDMKSAQNAQLLQSLTHSQQSSNCDPMDSSSSNCSGSNSNSTHRLNNNGTLDTELQSVGHLTNGSNFSSLKEDGLSSGVSYGDHNNSSNQEEAAKLISFVDSTLDENQVNSLMDSSFMFDELKDKMIESTHILESLAKGDDGEEDEDEDDGGQGGQVRPRSLQVMSLQADQRPGCRCNCHLKANAREQQADQPSESQIIAKLSPMSKQAVDVAIQCDLLS